ncbi:5'-nucleotidase/sulfur-oxidizing protein SoxB [Gillisia sp. Hel_I_86]|uniref:bifunctional metallophosphatase/5'-nucleotidase n=1 Tax=Gillisia sp. Hel_I_86 TaxID=1249981 RepID=UPI00119C7BEF|nr:bifunctional UDP-sugar hydrolase/5'-nucleotidase [Gillisia sp. Hel_I_86]TVZ27144.1 5'-nucleotidase/sulfur-oxidizing protein SoxB [Gillisia sp. Hel_I_86]
MRYTKFFIPVLGIASVLSLSCNSTKKSATLDKLNPQKVASISILHTNDMHGSYMPFETNLGNATAQTGDSIDNYMKFERKAKIGGFEYLASAIKSIRKNKGDDSVILLDGGDTFSDDQLGNLTKGEAMIKMMNEVNYDLMVLGNHDFDYGLERTNELQQLANFPMRAANIIVKETGKPIFGEPYVVINKQGVNIAILALSYRNTPLTGNSKNIEGLEFGIGAEAVKEYLPMLTEKADIIVLLSHEGMAVDKIIAEEIEGVDLIVGAHSHDVISPPLKINNTYIVQALSDVAILGETEIQISNNKIIDINANYHYLWHDEMSPDVQMQEMINQLRKPYLSKLEEKITKTNSIIGRQYKSESPFDKVVTSMMMDKLNVDAAFLPGVGYGISLEGDITSEDVFKLLPHPAKIVTLEMTGDQIRRTLEQTAINIKPTDKMNTVGGLIQSSGIQYNLNFNNPVGQRISDIKIKGENLDLAKTYKIATHTGMLGGIHNYEEFGKGLNINKTNIVLTEFVLENLRELKELSFPERMGEVILNK